MFSIRWCLVVVCWLVGISTACAPGRGGLDSSKGGRAARADPTEIVWIRIPGGTFEMGNDDVFDRSPVHEVTVPDFEMSRTEVTVAQYRACVEAGSCSVDGLEGGRTSPQCNWPKEGRDDHPINCVDLEKARAFAAWVGGRLPTEAEWEYAARGNEPYPHAGSEDPEDVGCWGGMQFMEGTCPVGSKRANGFGLVDMSGNVSEWVADCWHGWFRSAPSDGSAWLTDCQLNQRVEQAVERGGSYGDSYIDSLSVTQRYCANPEWGRQVTGIRVARDVADTAATP